jgi:hypothetical protein
MPAQTTHRNARSEQTVIAEALRDTLISPNVSDANLEAANLVDVGANIANALWKLARTGDPAHVGALEAHGEAIKEAAGMIAEALVVLADAIRHAH